MELVHGIINGWGNRVQTLIHHFWTPWRISHWSNFYGPQSPYNYSSLFWWMCERSHFFYHFFYCEKALLTTANAVVCSVFTFMVVIEVIYFMHMIDDLFWVRLNSVLDVTHWWQLVWRIFRDDITNSLITGVTSGGIMLSDFFTTSLAVGIITAAPFFSSWF